MVVMFGATHEQKTRFAELVRSSWWMPTRLSSIRTYEAKVGSLDEI